MESALGFFAVRATRVGEHPVYVIGGRRLDKNFSLWTRFACGHAGFAVPESRRTFFGGLAGRSFADSPEGMCTGENLSHWSTRCESPNKRLRPGAWSGDQAEDEVFHAIPLLGAGAGKDRPLLAILLIGNSRRTYVELKRHIRSAALLAGWRRDSAGDSAEQLGGGASDASGGAIGASRAGSCRGKLECSGGSVVVKDELAQLAESFNRMTSELLAQKERLVQAERVAAWRELARRLAHELKNPLFPLQLTVENLVRARQQSPEQFEEVFRESSRTLLAEISNLKGIIGRFSEFSKMPQPHLQRVQVNEVIRGVAQLFQAQLDAPGLRKSIANCNSILALEPVAADAELLHRAISNLVLNAMDAMPQGGTLTLRTQAEDGKALIEVADTGSGLTRGRMRPNLYSLLHQQAARNRTGAGHCAVGGERSWRENPSTKRAGTRNDFCD